MSAVTQSKPTQIPFENELEDHPEDHFLSPMYEYENWDSDDDDGEDVEWNAGITDFALFDTDRRRAQEEHEQLPSRWEGFLSTQQSALQRAMERTRAASAPDTTRPPLPFNDVPGLTPDGSPNLCDDQDVESCHGRAKSMPPVPSYLTVTLTPPPEEERMIDDDDDLPLSFYAKHAKERKQTRRKLERPGLRHTRTMSGKVHVWRRPSWHIYTVGEEPCGEEG